MATWQTGADGIIKQNADTTGTGNELLTQAINVYKPEQWEAWRALQTGSAYDTSILNRYMSEYVDPTYQKMLDARVNQARNTYGPSKSGYFSASTALAQQRAQQEVGEAQAALKAEKALAWNTEKNQMRAAMLDKRPEEIQVYRATPTISTSGISYPSGGGISGLGSGFSSGSGSSSTSGTGTGSFYNTGTDTGSTTTGTGNYGNWYDYYNTPLTNEITQSRLANYDYGDTSDDWFNNVYSNEEAWDPSSEATTYSDWY